MKRWVFLLILLIAIPAWGQPRAKPKTAPPPAPAPRAVGLDGTITWSAPGGTWNTTETVTDVDMNEIATEVNACFSTGDTVNAGSFPMGSGSFITVGNGASITASGTGSIVATNVKAQGVTLPLLNLTDAGNSTIQTRCTAAGTPDVVCGAAGDVFYNVRPNTITDAELSDTITFPSGSLVDYNTGVDTGTEGLRIPRSSVCTNATFDGQLCWATSTDTLWVGDGTGGPTQIAGGSVWTDAGSVLWPSGSESVGNDATGTNWLITNAGVATFAGAVTAASLTAAPSAVPSFSLDDISFTGTEAIVRGDSPGDDNGRIELLVENGTPSTYQSGVTICSDAGNVKTLLGAGTSATGAGGAAGTCNLPAGNGVIISEAGAMTKLNSGTIEATSVSCTGCVTATELATDAVDTAEIKNGAVLTPKLGPIARTRMCEWNIETPAAADDGLFQCYIPATSSITKLVCSSVGASTLVNLYERTTPDTGSTDMLTADVSCDADGAVSGTAPSGWTDFNVAAGRFLALSIGGTPTATLVRVHVEYTVD